MGFTSNNDINFVQASDNAIIGAAGGNDIYVVSSSLMAENQQVTITDTQGVNTLRLVDGLTISSSLVTADALQLTLSNGAQITLLGASSFSFGVGGDAVGTGEVTQDYATFVTETLNLAAVPAPGDDPAEVGVVEIGEGGSSTGETGNYFTLTEAYDEGSPAVADVTALYWGYTPNVDDGNNSDGIGEPVTDGHGVPVADMLDFLTSITGLDLFELGLVDDDGVGPFDNVTNLELEFGDAAVGDAGELTIFYDDGTSMNAEIVLGEEYFFFLNNLLFDEDGNSRLYERVIEQGEDATGPSLVPIVLTTHENNGGTFESGFTTADDDTIVSGRLELLHGAYIDGGGGYDILEVDAKGTYAQPLRIANVEEVRVQNLPNVYTTLVDGDGYLDNSSYPQLSGDGADTSVLDLSRAVDIEKIVITEGLGTGDDLGALTVVGIRNGATARFEGGFTEDVTLHYGQGLTGSLNVELMLGDVENNINILQNTQVLNIDSQGIENNMHHFFAGGNVSRMYVEGEAVFAVEEDLADSFYGGRPAIIDASANTGGLDVTLNTHYDLTIIGTEADDELTALNSIEVSIAAGNGQNDIDVDGSEYVDITSGDGADEIFAQEGIVVNIAAGDGDNYVETDDSEDVTITTGAGNDTIYSWFNDVVSIDAGDGANDLEVSAFAMNVTTGDGNDSLEIFGRDEDFVNGDDNGDDNYDVGVTGAGSPGALLNINVGGGNNAIILGADVDIDDDDIDEEVGITALEGSVIAGSNISVFVENDSDLTEADLSGATFSNIMLKEELTLTAEQVSGIDAGVFNVFHADFGATEDLHIVVSEDTTLSDLIDLSGLSTNVRLNFELRDGATLTLTAQELHTYVAEEGIDSTDGLNGKVVITEAGTSFDAFDNGDDYQVIDGGTLSDTFLDSDDVTIIRSINGFNRPEPDDSIDTLTVTSTGGVNNVIDGIIAPAVMTLILNGDEDMTFTDSVLLNDGFTIDFSGLDATLSNLTIADFQKITVADGVGADFTNPANDGRIIGNDVAGTRINVELNENLDVNGDGTGAIQVGAAGNSNGLKSIGVSTYVVTVIGDVNDNDVQDDTAVFYVCDNTQDLDILGLQGNAGNTIDFLQVNWNTTFLLEGDGFADWTGLPKVLGNPDSSNIGTLNATFFVDGGTAVIDINNRGVDLGVNSTGGERSLNVDGIEINNADGIVINIQDGDAVIGMLAGDSVDDVVISSVEDVTVQGTLDNLADLASFDASNVDGIFVLDITSGVNDISDVVVSGFDQVLFSDDAAITLTVDQALSIGLGNFHTAAGVDSTMNFVDLADQEIDMTSIDISDIGTVAIEDVNGTVILNAGTVLGNAIDGADSVTIVAQTSDTTVEMTAEQFNQIEGTGTVDIFVGVNAATGDDFVATLVVTDLAEGDILDFADVDANQVVRIDGTVAIEDFTILNGDSVVIEVAGGVNDLIDGDLTGADIDAVVFTADGELTLTAAQILAIEAAYVASGGTGETAFSVEPGFTVTLNVTELGGAAIDLGAIEDAGINIGEVSTADADVTLHADTTLGGADQLTITLDENDRTLTLSAAQFLQLADGTIVEADSDATVDNSASVIITNLLGITDEDVDGNNVADIDLSNVNVTGDQQVLLAAAGSAADVTLHADADLGDFAVILDSIGNNDLDQLNNLDGQTIRFNTAVQAEREIIVNNDDGVNDNGTNVVWLFDTITGTVTAGKVDTSDYDANLGRVWMLSDLVDGANVEELFTSLADATIIRVVNVEDLLLVSNPINRHVEIESFTNLPNGLTFNDLDADAPFEHVQFLTLDMGGAVTMGALELDNVLSATVDSDDEFETLTINSMIANATDHYLLPEDFDPLVNVLPVDLFDPADRVNVIGDIASGDERDELATVILNSGFNADGDDGAVDAWEGIGLDIQTIYLSDDTGNDPTASVTLSGENNVTIKSLDTSDPEITALNITSNLEDGALLTITGGSPAFDGGGDPNVEDTETLDINGAGTIRFGYEAEADAEGVFNLNTDAGGNAYAGIRGDDLSVIDASGFGGAGSVLELGVIADIDSSDFTFITAIAGTEVTMTLGQAMVDGVLMAPELAADGVWTFGLCSLTITEDVTFNAGGTLNLTDVTLITVGDVDLSVLADGLVITGGTIEAAADDTLTLTAAQADGLTITGAGTVEITALEATPLADLSGIMTSAGDTGIVNAAVNTADDDDADALPEVIALSNDLGVAHVTISGDGEVSVTGAITPVDRNDPATGADTSDDDVPSFTVGATADLNLTALQVGNSTGVDETSWRLLANGAGAVNVADLSLNADADLSGLTATTVTAAVDNSVIFTGDLGTATVTVALGADLQAEGSILDGVTITGDGTVSVDDNAAGDPINADLSDISTAVIEFVVGANVGTITFPTLFGDPTALPAETIQTVRLTSLQADGQTITGANAGAEGAVEVTVSDADVDTDGDVDAFDLSNIDAATMTATVGFDATLDATVDLGEFDVLLANGVTLTLTGAQADGLSITDGANVANVTVNNIAGGNDLSNIDVGGAVTGVVSGGTVDLSGLTGLTALDMAAAADADLTLGAEQFGALAAGDNNTVADLLLMNSLIVDVVYDISGTDFNVDLTVNPATGAVSGSAAGLVQARTDDDADAVTANAFTTNILNAASSITHTDLGSVVTADSGAVGVAGVDDIFVYRANPTNNTVISVFSGSVGDGDKLDLSEFGDANNTATAVAGPLTTTANEVYFLNTGGAGDADSIAASAAALNLAAAWTGADATAYIVVADDNTSAVYKFVDTAASVDEVGVGELTLIGTVSYAMLVGDLIA